VELQILKACVQSRSAWNKIESQIESEIYSPEFQHIYELVHDYYTVDQEATTVDLEVLKTQCRQSLRNDKAAAVFDLYFNRVEATETSPENVARTILLAKKKETATKLVVALTNNKHVDEALGEYLRLAEMEDPAELNQEGMVTLNKVSITEFLGRRNDPTNRIPVLPKTLSDALGGGVRRRNHILIYGVPESGKSALAITLGAGFLKQGLKVLYIENEEPGEDTLARFLFNLCDMDEYTIAEKPQEAEALAIANGYENLTILDVPDGTMTQLEEAVKEHSPDVLFVNQIKNLRLKTDNEVLRLEKAAQFTRYLAKKYNLIGVSITQAGDSAFGKAVLGMDDVYYSKTGIPGTTDLMIGVGATELMNESGEKQLSFPKNKLNSNHGSVIVRFIPQLSKMRST